MRERQGRPNRTQHWVRLIAGLLLLAVVAYGIWRQRQAAPAQVRTFSDESATSDQGVRSGSIDRTSEEPPAAQPLAIIPGQSIRNLDGDVAYRGDVDVTATLTRIKAGKLLRFGNDGSTFQNREGRLPKNPAGYYKEYVHPTPGLSGPGPQRIVMGQDGETYYTPDHYATFRRLDKR
jgi:guanyl-specific ribonuclease Sa